MSLKSELINILEEFSDFMEFLGENRFKISAFRNGANAIRRYEGNFEEAVNSGEIKNVKGIGKGLLAFINEYAERQYVQERDEISAKIPDGIKQMMQLRGLGVKKVKVLFETHGIDSIDKLEKACKDNSVANTKGFGEKTQEKIVQSIKVFRRSEGYSLLRKTLEPAEEYLAKIRGFESVKQAELTGELRRIREVVSGAEILVEVSDYKMFQSELGKLVKDVEFNENTAEFVYDNRIKFILRLIEEGFEKQLFLTTGSKEFLNELDYNIDKFISEEKVFEEKGLNFIIPNKREEEFFENQKISNHNEDIVEADIKGLLHFHTVWSDGMDTLKDMCQAAMDYGLTFAAVTDHSKTAMYANGLTEQRILKQKDEIDALNTELDIRIFSGIESDILTDGSLDYPDDFLQEIDFIVASIHNGFNLAEDAMNARIIKAIENPYTDVLGHPTGRLLLSRDGYKLNQLKIIDACVANDVAIELNASNQRLDVDWRYLYYARERGCKIAINPDSHAVKGIADIRIGVEIARKAGVKAEEVINCLSPGDFVKYLNRKVSRNL